MMIGSTSAYDTARTRGLCSGPHACQQVQSTGAWLNVDLGYSGRLAAVGVDLGSTNLMELNIRVGSTVVATGLENPLCVPTIANLPGFSKTLFGCAALGRYVTVQV